MKKKIIPPALQQETTNALKPIQASSLAKAVVLPTEIQLQRSLWGNLIITGLCIAMTLFVYSNQRQDILLAQNVEGKIYAPPYSDEPQMSSEAVINWAIQAVTAIYNYDMNNVEERLVAARAYFTPEGWASLKAALTRQDFLKQVKESKQIVSSVNIGAPVIIEENDKGGIHTWSILVTVRTSVDTGRSTATSTTSPISLTVERIPTTLSPGGYALGITKIGR